MIGGSAAAGGAEFPAMRIGQGFDAHRFCIRAHGADCSAARGEATDVAPGERAFHEEALREDAPSRELWLACIRWTDDEARGVAGFEGDSDGDVAAHALIDAMLSACDMGDIGSFFGVGASSRGAGLHGAPMLREVAAACSRKGWRFANGCVTIVGNEPHVSRHRDDAARAMSAAAGFPVRLTATTSDGMGFTGRGEGAAALASVLAYRG